MSWAEIKKAVNSDISMPLNRLFGIGIDKSVQISTLLADAGTVTVFECNQPIMVKSIWLKPTAIFTSGNVSCATRIRVIIDGEVWADVSADITADTWANVDMDVRQAYIPELLVFGYAASNRTNIYNGWMYEGVNNSSTPPIKSLKSLQFCSNLHLDGGDIAGLPTSLDRDTPGVIVKDQTSDTTNYNFFKISQSPIAIANHFKIELTKKKPSGVSRAYNGGSEHITTWLSYTLLD